MYTSDVACEVRKKAEMAKRAARALRNLSRDTKDAALRAMAQALEDNENAILESNSIDMANGEKKGLGDALLDRLKLNHARIMAMAEGLRELANLEDPVGTVSELTRRPNGLLVGKMRVPLGVIGFVFESRPNVTADTSGLCIKSGNAIIMRGGSEAYNSNRILTKLLADAAVSCGIPQGAIQLVESTDREGVRALATSDDLIDLMIVRGGEQLVRAVSEYATVPSSSMGRACATYWTRTRMWPRPLRLRSTPRWTDRVCNAMETLLVHKDIAQACLPQLVARLCESGVELVGCPRTVDLLKDHCDIKLANDSDWDAEYLALKLSIKIVDSYEEAVDHICSYGSGHTEAIVTENHSLAMQFLDDVDASVVLVNASTRFNDGFQLGLAQNWVLAPRNCMQGAYGIERADVREIRCIGAGSSKRGLDDHE